MEKKRKKIILVSTFIFLIVIAIYFLIPKSPEIQECQIDSDCVPASCCHPNSCVPINQKPICEDVFCTMNCEGPLDCEAGHCGCVKDKCKVIPD